MEAKGHVLQFPVAILGCAGQIWPCTPRFKHVYIYIYWLRFVHKPLFRYIYMYMGHIRPIQALNTYIWIPYIYLMSSFGCEYTLCHLYIPFQHVASLLSYIRFCYMHSNKLSYLFSLNILVKYCLYSMVQVCLGYKGPYLGFLSFVVNLIAACFRFYNKTGLYFLCSLSYASETQCCQRQGPIREHICNCADICANMVMCRSTPFGSKLWQTQVQ